MRPDIGKFGGRRGSFTCVRYESSTFGQGRSRRPAFGPGDHDQRIRIIRPVFATGPAGLKSLVDPAVKVRRRVLLTDLVQPAFVLVEVLGHDLAVVDPHEQVADRKLGTSVVDRAARPEQLGKRRRQARCAPTPMRSGSGADVPTFRASRPASELGTRHPQA